MSCSDIAHCVVVPAVVTVSICFSSSFSATCGEVNSLGNLIVAILRHALPVLDVHVAMVIQFELRTFFHYAITYWGKPERAPHKREVCAVCLSVCCYVRMFMT